MYVAAFGLVLLSGQRCRVAAFTFNTELQYNTEQEVFCCLVATTNVK